jgi:hypothetical protein
VKVKKSKKMEFLKRLLKFGIILFLTILLTGDLILEIFIFIYKIDNWSKLEVYGKKEYFFPFFFYFIKYFNISAIMLKIFNPFNIYILKLLILIILLFFLIKEGIKFNIWAEMGFSISDEIGEIEKKPKKEKRLPTSKKN